MPIYNLVCYYSNLKKGLYVKVEALYAVYFHESKINKPQTNNKLLAGYYKNRKKDKIF